MTLQTLHRGIRAEEGQLPPRRRDRFSKGQDGLVEASCGRVGPRQVVPDLGIAATRLPAERALPAHIFLDGPDELGLCLVRTAERRQAS